MFNTIVSRLNEFVWGPIMLILLVGTGVIFSIQTGFLPLSKVAFVLKNTLGKLFIPSKKTAKGTLSPFQALSTALAGTIGTGNIVGVATAIVAGGPGAVFWMWVSAFFGMTTKYAEVLLAVKFREKNKNGEWSGGPMYYIVNGISKKLKPLAVIFCLFAILASFGIGNITQVNSIAISAKSTFGIPQIVTGIIVAAVVAIVIVGGVSRIGSFTEKIVVVMSVGYIIVCVWALYFNRSNITPALQSIFKSAFDFKSVYGGVAGYTIYSAMKFGISRGVFSNEAGMGSAPIAHAAADTKEPVEQAVYGIFEVFFDTIIICTLTALVILSSGLFGSSAAANLQGIELTIASFATAIGANSSGIFFTFAMLFFAFSTIIGWSYYGVKCIEFLARSKVVTTIYKIVFVALIIVGSFLKSDIVWTLADLFNGLMAFPNLIALLALSGVVVTTTKKYFETKNKLN